MRPVGCGEGAPGRYRGRAAPALADADEVFQVLRARIPFTCRLDPKFSVRKASQNGIWCAAMEQHREDYQK